MYQPHRRALASAATSPRTNPYRSNNDREDMSSARRSTDSGPSGRVADSSSDLSGSQSLEDEQAEQLKEAIKLNQIVSQFFLKGALTIVSSRTTLNQCYNRNGDVRVNKWFNLLVDESQELLDQLTEWRNLKLETGQNSPSLIIEVYLDLNDVPKNQILVTRDDEDKRYNVAEALATSTSSNTRPSSRSGSASQLTLERWEISLDQTTEAANREALHSVYKKAVPVFRALWTLSKTLPAWKLVHKGNKHSSTHGVVKPRYRVLNGQFKNPRADTINLPLYSGQEAISERYALGALGCPAGELRLSLTYRRDCDFKVDNAESLLSSQFMGMDDRYYEAASASGREVASDRGAPGLPSSMPTAGRMPSGEEPGRGQVYGSLATFHRMGPAPGTSPLSALRAVQNAGSYSPSSNLGSRPTSSRALEAKSSLRSVETAPAMPRRPSVSFQPFKAGSLASSPSLMPPPSPSSSYNRASGLDPLATIRQHRHSLSGQTIPQVTQRKASSINESAVASSAGSSPRPAPMNRYSSSFGHRRTRLSIGGSASKENDDQNSSGKQSASSSTRRSGSDVINEGQGGSSSGSIPAATTDDDNLKDFIKLLEQKKDLKSLNRRDSTSREASMRRTTAALSKYQRMRDSTAALSDDLSTSLMLHRSSSSSSRQLGAVPQMIPASSISTSSSPGKPISPHTPHTHTPAIRSRLSANEILDYGDGAVRSRSRAIRGQNRNTVAQEDVGDDGSSNSTARDNGTNAIDIPTSPRAWPFIRRSSSVAQQNRIVPDDEPMIFGLRSSSLPGAMDERTDVNIEELAQMTEGLEVAPYASGDNEGDFIPEITQSPDYTTETALQEDSSTLPPHESYEQHPATRFVPRLRGSHRGFYGLGDGSSASASALTSASGSASASRQALAGESRGGFGSSRVSLASRPYYDSGRDNDEYEPFMFDMSDIANASRRSLEDPRGGGSGSGSARGSGSGRGGERGGWR